MYKKAVLTAVIILVGLISLSFSNNSEQENSVKNNNHQDLFLGATKSFTLESPDFILIGKNTIAASSPAVIFSPQVLGALVGAYESEDIKKVIVEYEIETGDNLSSIAHKFDITLDTLLWANDLNKNSLIQPGQKLVVLPVSGVLYIIREGDTLSEIAETYHAEIKDIISFNELSNINDIFIGDILIIPGGKKPLALPKITDIPLSNSFFIFPCQGEITQGAHGAFNNAVDIGNKCGKPVVAAAGGIVQRAGKIWVGGNRVTIFHPINGTVTYYGHLSTISVKPGESVNTGDIIGRIGNTGYTLGLTGCHLHFTVRGAKNFLIKYPVGSVLKWK